MKSILITGGAGFIGSHLCDALINDNKIAVIDNLSLGRMNNIKHLLDNKNFKFIKADILSETLDAIFAEGNFDTVIHLAANSDIAVSHDNPNVDKDHTFMTTYRVLEMMKKYKTKEIVFSSTSAIYGDTADLLHENYGPLQPASHYGAGKLASEAFISSFVENYGIQAWIVRFPNVVGERATHGVIFDFIKKLNKNNSELEVLGDGEQYKPYLYVKDLVEAILFVWKNSSERLNIYNLGVNSRTKVKDIAVMVIEEMKLDATIKYTGGNRGWIGDVPEFNYDLTKVNTLGWKANNTSNEAVRKAIQYILTLDF
ncbi:NAD-dependent epimerase/dehydratase family protein [Winogradskyella sp. PG-2]|uniref:NAD-dependent epimerase/dehydratase family protein n=1 Tax=Winogradskyella sp. PG-2 TaxID=754409 RepID=UPI0004589394|nr:NAD-dependent epimerase/dehydratase family protein [Winogradskyella sp. PG-2]BAO75046.1 UDP-glucose 4-epimerase [Winogradskyella sp. PG-2]